jgi:hypothetical protein
MLGDIVRKTDSTHPALLRQIAFCDWAPRLDSANRMGRKRDGRELKAASCRRTQKPRGILSDLVCCISTECSHASHMRRIFFVAIIMLAMVSSGATGREAWENAYVMKMIDATETQERNISRMYDYFLRLIAGGTIERGAKFTTDKRFFAETETHAIFLWAYYISPNELRGFEVSIPKELLKKNGESYTTLVELQAAEISTHQEQKIIVLKRATRPAKTLRVTRHGVK